MGRTAYFSALADLRDFQSESASTVFAKANFWGSGRSSGAKKATSVDEINKDSLPAGTKLDVVDDGGKDAESSLANVVEALIFGAGLTAGLLGQIAEALASNTLDDVARVASWMLPFEALYQAGLHGLTADISGITGVIVNLGPFGGAQDAGAGLWLWTAAYLVLVGVWARHAFMRRDL